MTEYRLLLLTARLASDLPSSLTLTQEEDLSTERGRALHAARGDHVDVIGTRSRLFSETCEMKTRRRVAKG